jgi:hypothetical protein
MIAWRLPLARGEALASPTASDSTLRRSRKPSSIPYLIQSQHSTETWWSETSGCFYAQTKYLDAVNEFGQRDVGLVAKNVDGTEVIMGPVLELEAQKVPIVRK